MPCSSVDAPSSDLAKPREVPTRVAFVSGWCGSVFLGSSIRALMSTEPLRISVSVHSSQMRSAGSPLESAAPVRQLSPWSCQHAND